MLSVVRSGGLREVLSDPLLGTEAVQDREEDHRLHGHAERVRVSVKGRVAHGPPLTRNRTDTRRIDVGADHCGGGLS